MKHLGRAEREILEKVALGMRDDEIAEARGSSRKTVRSQVEDIRLLLGIHSRASLIAWAWCSGWMTSTPDWALQESA
jgi:DNA-binding CsgD family transcriptional regulator